MHACMVKVISISDEAYNELRKIDEEKSFSEIVIEIVREKKKKTLRELAGSWSKEDADRIKKELYDERKIPSRRFK